MGDSQRYLFSKDRKFLSQGIAVTTALGGRLKHRFGDRLAIVDVGRAEATIQKKLPEQVQLQPLGEDISRALGKLSKLETLALRAQKARKATAGSNPKSLPAPGKPSQEPEEPWDRCDIDD